MASDTEIPYTYQSPDSRGPMMVGAGALAVVALFMMFWVITESAKTAAAIMTVLIIVSASALVGAWINHRAATRAMETMAQSIVTAITAMPQMQPPAPAAPQLPAPREAGGLLPVDDSMMVTKEQIQATASKIYHRMYPHTEPTRPNIKEMFPALTSHGYITKCMEYLRDYGLVEGGGQGREYRWVVGE